MMYESKDLTAMANVVRADALRAILAARSGHVGIVLSSADIVTTIYANFLRPGVDRFVLSAGHGSALLYSVLHNTGHDIGDLATFRQIGGLPGHPEYGIHGVSATTGPLGQGVANAVGMAMAERIKGTDGRIYCLCGDGDISEGVAQEAIAFAGRYKLNNLVLLWDDNGLTIDGMAMTDMDMLSRMRSAGWHTDVAAADDFDALNRALRATSRARLPVFVDCKSILGCGSSRAGVSAAHGYGLPDAELTELANKYDTPHGRTLWRKFAATHSWPVDVSPRTELPRIGWTAPDGEYSTRELAGMYLDALVTHGVPLVMGSADLGTSTNVHVPSARDITASDFSGNYINYGVREHAMAAIMNGMAACGLRPVGSTFLVFSDYMRGAMRMSAISGLPVIYILTHDSIAVGSDGPTHQPVEQLPSLRMIPNMNVFRPYNSAEVVYSMRRAISDTHHPSCIILSRQKFPMTPSPNPADIRRGGYVIAGAGRRRVRATIIATGADVALALDVAKKLGPGVQVVSMPSVADFRAQDASYQQQILRGFVVVIEAASTSPWFEFADAVVGMNGFGASGPGGDVYRHFGFDVDRIARDIADKIK